MGRTRCGPLALQHPVMKSLLPAWASAPWRRAFGLAIGSAFLLWHSLVLLIGCAPPSYSVSQIYPFFAPYIEFLHLDGGWSFFAPDPNTGRLVRYSVRSADGVTRAYRLTENLQRSDRAYLRFTTLSAAVRPDYPEVIHSVAQRLCRQHASENPQSVQFTLARQTRITPEEYEAGHRPLDADFLRLEDLPAVTCQQ
jgi:hypothetical protein